MADSMADSVPLQPAVPFLLMMSLLVFTLAFTKAQSPIRVALAPGLSLLLAYSLRVRNAATNLASPMTLCLFGGATAGLALKYLDCVVFSAWGFEEQGPTRALGGSRPVSRLDVRSQTHGRHVTVFSRLRFGLAEAFRLRHVDTPWEAKNVPPFRASDSAFVPQKSWFVIQASCRMLLYAAVLDLATFAPPPDPSSVRFTPSRIPFLVRLGEVDGAELTMRVVAVLGHWAIMYCMIQMLYLGLAVFSVSMGFTNVRVWRPLFGDVRDSWSVRNYWGCFWHQSMRQSFSSPATFITEAVLRLRRGGLIARYIRIIATYVCSGVYHVFIDMSYGIPQRSSGALRFFCCQALAIILEDTVRFAYHTTIKDPSNKDRETKLWEKAIGFIWVAVWLVWSTPAISYPMAQKNAVNGGSYILPFSPIRILSRYFYLS